jgi:hypothetical protein
VPESWCSRTANGMPSNYSPTRLTAAPVRFMLSRGCTLAVLRHLARSRLTITDRVRVPGERRGLTVARLRISNAGRKALAAPPERPWVWILRDRTDVAYSLDWRAMGRRPA